MVAVGTKKQRGGEPRIILATMGKGSKARTTKKNLTAKRKGELQFQKVNEAADKKKMKSNDVPPNMSGDSSSGEEAETQVVGRCMETQNVVVSAEELQKIKEWRRVRFKGESVSPEVGGLPQALPGALPQAQPTVTSESPPISLDSLLRDSPPHPFPGSGISPKSIGIGYTRRRVGT